MKYNMMKTANKNRLTREIVSHRSSMKTLDDLIDERDNRHKKTPNTMDRFVAWMNAAYWKLRCYLHKDYRNVKITSLPRGYYDADTRLFYSAFDLLVEFIETELAWMALILPEEGEGIVLPWWQTKNAYLKAHAEELAMSYFKWAKEYVDADNPTQGHPKAEAHKELKELYLWWKHDRPVRINPTEYYWEHRKVDSEALQKSMAMEESFEAEDTANFIRLVKNKGAMWT
jgi:hypothetical protein